MWNLREASDRCFKVEWAGKRSEKTNIINIQALLEYFGEKTLLEDITTEKLDYFILDYCRDIKGNTGATINRKIACLSKIMRFALSRDKLSKLPKFPRQKESNGRIRYLSHEEEHEITKYFSNNTDILDFIIVAMDTGLRVSELLRLTQRDITNGMVTVWENKADLPRSIPMTDRVRKILNRRSCNPVFPFKSTYIRGFFGHMRNDLIGLSDVTPHVLRHTFASRLAQLGIPIINIQELMGHKTIQMTMRYSHLSPKNREIDISLLSESVA